MQIDKTKIYCTRKYFIACGLKKNQSIHREKTHFSNF